MTLFRHVQIQELQEQLETKEKEARSNALTAKLTRRKLEEVKASAAKAVAGVNARVAEAVAVVEARHKQQEAARVHLMLCVIREPVVETKQQLTKPQVEAVQGPKVGSYSMELGMVKVSLLMACTAATRPRD
jgi:hypothetical protein